MNPTIFAGLGCAAVFLASLFLLRLLVRMTRFGYVPGALLMTVVPSLLLLRVLLAVDKAYLPHSIAFHVAMEMLIATGAGMVLGGALGWFSNRLEAKRENNKK